MLPRGNVEDVRSGPIRKRHRGVMNLLRDVHIQAAQVVDDLHEPEEVDVDDAVDLDAGHLADRGFENLEPALEVARGAGARELVRSPPGCPLPQGIEHVVAAVSQRSLVAKEAMARPGVLPLRWQRNVEQVSGDAI